MSEEQKELENKECKCFCTSKGFRNFLTVALGVFVGVYCALCLFTAIHRPPMPPCAFGYRGEMRGCPVKLMHQHFNKPMPLRPDFQSNDKFQPDPFEAKKPLPKK